MKREHSGTERGLTQDVMVYDIIIRLKQRNRLD